MVPRRRSEEQFLEKAWEKANDALCGVKKAVEEIKGKASLHIPEMMMKKDEVLVDADKSFDSADYEKNNQALT